LKNGLHAKTILTCENLGITDDTILWPYFVANCHTVNVIIIIIFITVRLQLQLQYSKRSRDTSPEKKKKL